LGHPVVKEKFLQAEYSKQKNKMVTICQFIFRFVKIGFPARGIQEFVRRGFNYLFIFPGEGGAQHPLGPESPLKSIDFTGPGGLSPHSPPPLILRFIKFKPYSFQVKFFNF